MNRCKGLTGLLFGHHFVARYDTDESAEAPQIPDGLFKNLSVETAISCNAEDVSDIIMALSADKNKSVYVHDVCIRCGSVVDRESKPASIGKL